MSRRWPGHGQDRKIRGPWGPGFSSGLATHCVSCVLAIFAMAPLILLPGCAGPLRQWGSETSLVSRAPGFDPAVLGQRRVAVLNALVGFGYEGFSHQVSRSLSRTLREEHRATAVLSPLDAISRINQAGLAKDYTELVGGYMQSGVLHQEGLRRIGEALMVDYVFQPIMASFEQSVWERFSFLGIRLFQTRVSVLRLSVQLWDAKTGAIAWESSGEATLAGEDVREYRIPFEDIAHRLWSQILKDLAPAPAAP